jgi:hypothetical protein
MIASQAHHANIPSSSFSSGEQKTAVLHASTDAVESFKKQDPLFCQFLLVTGRLVVGVERNERKFSTP